MKKYMCGITFEYELGNRNDIHIYDSIEELKEKHSCYESCGIVEIETEGKPEDYTSSLCLLERKPWRPKTDPEAKKESDQ